MLCALSRGRRITIAAITVLCATAAPTQASPGATDPGFGTNGSTFWGVDDQYVSSQRPLIVATADRVYVVESGSTLNYDTWQTASRLHITALDAHGRPLPGFGTGGQAVAPLPVGHRAVAAGLRPDGHLSIVTTDGQGLRLVVVNTTGAVVLEATPEHQHSAANATVLYSETGDVQVLPDGRIAYIVELDGTRSLVASGLDGENLNIAHPLGEDLHPVGMTVTDEGRLAIAVSNWTISTEVRLLDAQLNIVDESAGPSSEDSPRLAAVDARRAYWTVADWSEWPGRFELQRWTADVPDPGWEPYEHELGDLQVAPVRSAGVIISAIRQGRLILLRLNDDGTPDETFGKAGIVEPAQAYPTGYDGRSASPPTAGLGGRVVALSVQPKVTPNAIGSSTLSGYGRLWLIGAPTTPPTPDSDPVADLGSAAQAQSGPAVTVPPSRASTEILQTVRRPKTLPAITARTCVSRRRFAIRLRKGPGNRHVRITAVNMTVGGRRAPVSVSERRRGVVNLRGLPRGRFVVRARLRLANGQTIIDTRRYRTCSPKRISKQNKNRKPAPVEVTR
ncbi:MAG: hypothetical protein JHD16_00500 [Solirubrobacteraceae bacterium]|nr:hypothetical protein [Solirubrobacteraceae bacterium]